MAEVLKMRFLVRSRPAAEWEALDEVLLGSSAGTGAREIGIEEDTGRLKLGPGKWSELEYFNGRLEYLRDVGTAAPSDGDVLTFDAASSKWIPGAPAGGGGNGIALSGRKLTYADLPTTGVADGEAYLVASDGLIYVRDSGAWPAEGEGLNVGARNAAVIGSGPTAMDTGTSVSTTAPASVAVGGLLLACIMHRDTLTAPSGWTLVKKSDINPGGTQYTSVYAKVAASADAGSTVTFTQATSQRYCICIVAFTNGATVQSSQKFTKSGLTTSIDCPDEIATGGCLMVQVVSMYTQITSGTSTMTSSLGWAQLTPAAFVVGSGGSATGTAIRLGVAVRGASGLAEHNVFTQNTGTGWTGLSLVVG